MTDVEKLIELEKMSTYDKLIKKVLGLIVGHLTSNTIAHNTDKYLGCPTVLEAATGSDVSHDFFAVKGGELANAEDSPSPGAEYHYLALTFRDVVETENEEGELVVTENYNRRIVIAFTFTDTDKPVDILYRHIWQDNWVQDKWTNIIDKDGYLPLTGGTLSGDIKITTEGSNRQAAMQSNLQERAAILYNIENDLNYTALVVRPETESPEVLLQVNTRSGDTQNSYNVYHTGNLPTALRTDENGSAYVVKEASEEVVMFGVYHEGNPPSPDAVGAASAEDHNIRTYTSLNQIGLSNDVMSSDNFLANIKSINTALGDGDVILYLTTTSADNLHHSIVSKLNADRNKTLDTNSINTISVKISRTGNIYTPITTDVVYNSTEEDMFVYSCIYNKEADEANDELTKFVVTTDPAGFLSTSGGNITGDLTINDVNVATEEYVDGKVEVINTNLENLKTEVTEEIGTKIEELDTKINEEISTEIKDLDDKITALDTKVTEDVNTKISDLETRINDEISTKISALEDKTGQYVPFHVGTTAPTDTKLLWIDTANGLKYHNGTDWVVVPVSYS